MQPLAVTVVIDPSPLRERRQPATAPSRRSASADGARPWPVDRVSISGEARGGDGAANASGLRRGGADELHKDQLLELQRRDAHVRSHEAAHQGAAGALGGGASFTYQVGPDGKRYAVGGEVPIRLAKGRTPRETIAVARQVRAAALAPSDPSAQDLAVAASASSMEAEARAELARRAAVSYRSGARAESGGAAPETGDGATVAGL